MKTHQVMTFGPRGKNFLLKSVEKKLCVLQNIYFTLLFEAFKCYKLIACPGHKKISEKRCQAVRRKTWKAGPNDEMMEIYEGPILVNFWMVIGWSWWHIIYDWLLILCSSIIRSMWCILHLRTMKYLSSQLFLIEVHMNNLEQHQAPQVAAWEATPLAQDVHPPVSPRGQTWVKRGWFVI